MLVGLIDAIGDSVSMHSKYIDAALDVVKTPLEGNEEEAICASIDALDNVSTPSCDHFFKDCDVHHNHLTDSLCSFYTKSNFFFHIFVG